MSHISCWNCLVRPPTSGLHNAWYQTLFITTEQYQQLTTGTKRDTSDTLPVLSVLLVPRYRPGSTHPSGIPGCRFTPFNPYLRCRVGTLLGSSHGDPSSVGSPSHSLSMHTPALEMHPSFLRSDGGSRARRSLGWDF